MSTSSTASRPAYPQHQTSGSTASSLYQSSSSSVASLSSQPRSQSHLTLPQQSFQQSQAAPLPSPTSQPYNPFQNSYIQQQTSQSATRRPEYRQEQSSGNVQANGDTGALLSQYSLVAEAARRAQMAVLARDLDAMEF